MILELKLPLPISVNQAYGGMKRRFKSAAYRKWESMAWEAIREYDLPTVEHKPLKVNYTYFMPCWYKNGNHKKIDAFNYEKVLSDFLSHAINGFEDEYIYKGTVEKVDIPDNEMPFVFIQMEYYHTTYSIFEKCGTLQSIKQYLCQTS